MKSENILKALNEAIDALGDIPAEDCTKQQKNAYTLCVGARDELLNNADQDDVEKYELRIR